MKSDEQRIRFVARRAWLRLVLSATFSCEPQFIALLQEGTGRPSLAHGDRDFSFSQSSSGDTVVVATGWGGPIGVDIEAVKQFDFAGMSPRHLAPGAWERVAATGWDICAFYEHWTAMEAVVKATGEGLSAAGAYDANPRSGRVTRVGDASTLGIEVKTWPLDGDCLAIAAPCIGRTQSVVVQPERLA